MAGLDPKKKEVPAGQIIPNLNEIGKQLRSNHHLYSGYENLIARILEFKEKEHGNQGGDDSVKVALSACYRFERLRDHIKFLVLNYLDEAIGEKDGLFTTVSAYPLCSSSSDFYVGCEVGHSGSVVQILTLASTLTSQLKKTPKQPPNCPPAQQHSASSAFFSFPSV